jgi:hypothetical protein
MLFSFSIGKYQCYNGKKHFKLLSKTTVCCVKTLATNGVEESGFLAG